MKVIAVSKRSVLRGKDWKKTCVCTNCRARLEVVYADLTLFDDRDGRAYRFICLNCGGHNWVSSTTVDGGTIDVVPRISKARR